MKFTGILTVVLLGCCLMASTLNAQPAGNKTSDTMRTRKMLASAIDARTMLSINMTTIDNNKKTFIVVPLIQIKNSYIRCIGVSIDNTGSLIDFLISIDIEQESETRSDGMWFKSDYEGLLCTPQLSDIHDIKPYKDETLKAMFDTYINDIQRCRNEVLQGADPGAKLEFMFLDGKKLQGFIDCPQRSVLETLFLIDVIQSQSIRRYTEYEVECLSGIPSLVDPAIVKVKPNRLYEGVQFALEKLVKRPGLLTNRMIWMGRNYPPNTDSLYRSWKSMEQYQLRSLFSLTLIDITGQPHLFFLGDILALSRIERVDQGMLVADYHPLFSQLEGSYDVLKSAWTDPSKPMVYVDFANRPPARGKLVEYVPSYHLGVIPHAVLEDSNGKLVSLHDVMGIRAMFKANEMIEINKATMDDQIDALYNIENPAVSITINTKESLSDPVKIKSIQSYSSHMELEIIDVVLYEQGTEPVIKNLIMPEGYTDTLHIMMTLTDSIPEASKGLWMFVDEFTIFNEKGEVVPFTAFVEPIGVTDSIVRYDQPREFLLVAIAKGGQETFRMRFRDMPLVIFKKESENAVSSDDQADK